MASHFDLWDSGTLQVWDRTNLAPRWQVALGENVSASLNMLCGNGSGPGTLLVATQAGTLHGIYVDASGLDATAPWPKYQHDQRNSGNASSSTGCP